MTRGLTGPLQIDNGHSIWNTKAIVNVTLAHAPHRRVNRDHKRFATRGLRALRQGLGEAAVA